MCDAMVAASAGFQAAACFMRAVRAGNIALGGLSAAGVSVVAFVAAQLLFGFTWGMVCRVLDCSLSGFMNPWVVVPWAIVSILASVYVGWLAGRKMYRGLQGLSGSS